MTTPTADAIDKISPALADELIELLGEAVTEIFNATDRGNPVSARLRQMQYRLERAKDETEATHAQA